MSKEIITLGTWSNVPMKWLVLWEDAFKMLLISESSVGSICYSINNNSNWAVSNMRYFLNGEFWNKCFTKEEKKRILNVKLPDVGNTKDNVFLISKSEADSLSLDDTKKRGYWCTRTANGGSSIIRYSGSWGSNNASAEYQTYPAIYLWR